MKASALVHKIAHRKGNIADDFLDIKQPTSLHSWPFFLFTKTLSTKSVQKIFEIRISYFPAQNKKGIWQYKKVSWKGSKLHQKDNIADIFP